MRALAVSMLVTVSSAGFCQTTPPQTGQQGPENQLPPINPDRPNLTNSPETVQAKHFQLEIGYQFTKTGTQSLHELGQVFFRGGLTDNFEIRLPLNSYAWLSDSGVNQRGFEDAGIGFKWTLRHTPTKFDLWKPGFALEGSATLPTGSSDFTAKVAQPEGAIYMGWTLTDKTNFGMNVVYDSLTSSGTRFDQWTIAAAYGYQFSTQWAGWLEEFSQLKHGAGGTNQHFVDGGLQYLVNNNSMLDFMVGFGMNSVRPGYFVSGGYSIRF